LGKNPGTHCNTTTSTVICSSRRSPATTQTPVIAEVTLAGRPTTVGFSVSVIVTVKELEKVFRAASVAL
jgi:hypothetical protein